MGARWFGASVQRKEDPALLQGRGRYIDDLSLPGMLHACFVRSTVAHARIARIEVGAAKRAPGVHAVLTFADLPEQLQSKPIPLLVPNPALSQPLMPHSLAHREVRYVGEIVAIVVAAELAGILGALLAIPIASMIQVIARDLWDHRRGRPKEEPTVGEERTPADAEAASTQG